MQNRKGWAARILLAGVGEKRDLGRLLGLLSTKISKVEVKAALEPSLGNRGKTDVPSLDFTTA